MIRFTSNVLNYSQGYFKSLMMEHENNIDVTIVSPGPVQTDFLMKSFTEKSGEVCKIYISRFIRKKCISYGT